MPSILLELCFHKCIAVGDVSIQALCNGQYFFDVSRVGLVRKQQEGRALPKLLSCGIQKKFVLKEIPHVLQIAIAVDKHVAAS